ncbi:MAG: multidrug efflux pump [Flavobacteriales bacterium]|jgi:multidrug efflux pump
MSISNWAIRHSITIFAAMLVLVVAGGISYSSLPREAEPDITIPFVMVTTPYFGVSPSDIETLITMPIEDELEQLKDVREIRSTSAEGASIISIEFEPSVDIDDALQKVRERVDTAESELPADAEDSMVSEISFSEFPVIVVNISGDVGLLGLERVAEELQDDIERIPGILEVALVGGVEREVRVEANPDRLEYYGVTLLEMVGAIQAANLNLPGGSIDVGDNNYLVRVPGEFEQVRDLETVVVRVENGVPIRLTDVAQIVDGFEDEATYSRLNRTPSVSLNISRRAGENIIEITDEIKRLIGEYEAEYGDALDFTTLADKSNDIRRQISELENNIITGLLLVTIVLFFFMGGFRNAIFVGVAIPLSMLISFVILSALGLTLNIVVLFSLVLALGMLVDNAIVTVENIYRHGAMGKSRSRAAMDGVAEVGWPIISSTATTVFAFVPLLFWPGLMGEFMYYMPLTVVVVLCSSLFVALVINPVLCSQFMALPTPDASGRIEERDEIESLPDNAFYRGYRSLLEFCVRYPPVIMMLAAAAFVGTIVTFANAGTGVEFFPETTPNEAYINVTLPDGSNVEASDRIVRQVELLLLDEPNIENFVCDVGGGNGDQMNFGAGGTAPHRSRITLDFIEYGDREEDVNLTLERIRDQLTDIAGADFDIVKAANGPPSGAAINLEIVGDNYDELGRIALEMVQLIQEIDGVVNLNDDYEAGRSELRVVVDREQAARVQVNTRDVANTVRAAINGIEASTLREGDEESDIVVRLEEPFRDSLEDVGLLIIIDKDGNQIPLTEIATVSVGRGFGSIRHVDGDRVVTISGDTAEGFQDAAVLAEVRERLAADFNMPPGYEIRYTGQNQDQAEAQEFLSRALLAGLFLIALVLITQFNSIMQPGIILASVLLSLLGVLWNLILKDAPFSVIMTGVGVISLAGVVVNNAIVMIDYVNQLKERGTPPRQAVVNAGLVRLRPVLLTAVTTALSLMPTMLGYSIDFQKSIDFRNWSIVQGGTSVELWGPMANAVVSGLAVATLLTLVVVPALYRAVDISAMVIERFTWLNASLKVVVAIDVGVIVALAMGMALATPVLLVIGGAHVVVLLAGLGASIAFVVGRHRDGSELP